MATIKSYTSLEQSRKLAEFLPLDSADMHYNDWNYDFYDGYERTGIYIADLGTPETICGVLDIPCWSLTALLNIIPKDKSIECSISFGYYNGKGEYIEKWLCAFEKEGETTDDYIIETIDGNNPVDACVEMILRLHELNLL